MAFGSPRWDILEFLQIDHFQIGEETPLTTGKFVFVETGKHDAVELDHLVAEVFEDAAHDAVAARMQLDADFLFAIVAFHVGDGVGSDRAVVKFDAICDAKHVVLRQGLVEGHLIKLRNLAARMGELLGQVAVVGEQQQAGGLFVETTHGEDTLGAGVFDQLHDRIAFIRIVGGGDIAFRLIQKDITEFLAVEGLASIHHFIIRFHLIAHGGDDFVVHHHTAGLDQVIGFATRADAAVGQVFVEADFASGFRAVGHGILFADIAFAATAWSFFIVETAFAAVVEAAATAVVVEAAARTVVVVETAFATGFVVIETATGTVVIVETALTRFVIVETATRTVVIMEAAFATRLVVIEAAAGTLIVEAAFATALVIKSAAWAVIVMEAALTRFVIVETTARTVVAEAAFATALIVETTAGTVAKLAVATIVIKSAFTSRLIAKLSLFFSFFVTVTVIKLEGSALLEIV